MAVIGNIDSLSHLFVKTQPLQKLYEYLCKASMPTDSIHKRILSMQVGENKIALDFDMFAIEQTYFLKDFKEAIFETHRIYVDFQLVVSGEEFFAIGERRDFEVLHPYDEKKDVIFYHQKTHTSKILLHQNALAIFFDYDVHSGGLALENLTPKAQVFKTVVKVPKELLKLKL